MRQTNSPILISKEKTCDLSSKRAIEYITTGLDGVASVKSGYQFVVVFLMSSCMGSNVPHGIFVFNHEAVLMILSLRPVSIE